MASSAGLLAALLCAAAVFAAADAVPVKLVGDGPAFCRNLDCPRYTTVNQTANYEIRQYQTSQWARTVIQSDNYTSATDIGFHRLFDYISGANVDLKEIPMTAPVTVAVLPGASPFCKSTFTVSFMVPFSFQPNPPRPSASNVYIETEAAHVAYVASFPGFARESDQIDHAQQLAQALTTDNIAFNSTVFYTAGYDSPYQLFNRHNEIWFYAPNQQ
eukprot:m.260986 g.260986  ORF g.260986 m.260986 type:complete len:216 (-) comp42519_c0_seq1:51-698(-)